MSRAEAKLVGLKDIQRHYKVSRATVVNWRRHPRFPEPVVMSGRSPVYDWVEIKAWYWDFKNVKGRAAIGGAAVAKFKAGQNMSEIARALKVDKSTVARTLRRLGAIQR